MNFLLWLGACLLIAIWSTRRPWIAPVAILTTWVLVPWVAREMLTGSDDGISGVFAPATWMAFVCVAWRLVAGRVPDERPHFFETRPRFAAAVIALFLVPHLFLGRDGVSFLVDQVVTPLVTYYLVVNASRQLSQNWSRLRAAFLTLAAIQCVIAVSHAAGVIAQPYESGLETQYWYVSTFDRETGTLDHPLVLATLLVGAVPLVRGIPPRYQTLLLPALAAGALLTQSRSGILLLAVGALTFVTARRLFASSFFVMVGVGASVAWLFQTGLATRTIDRFTYDDGSSSARSDAFVAFRDVDLPFLAGGGPGRSHAVSAELGLETSFESWPLMYLIDFGIIVGGTYLLAIIWLLWRSRTRDAGALSAAVLALVMTCVFSSLAVQSATATILWFLVGLVVASKERLGGQGASRDSSPALAFRPLERDTPSGMRRER